MPSFDFLHSETRYQAIEEDGIADSYVLDLQSQIASYVANNASANAANMSWPGTVAAFSRSLAKNPVSDNVGGVK